MRSRCVPCSTMAPFSMKMMWSAFLTISSWWDTNRIVRPHDRTPCSTWDKEPIREKLHRCDQRQLTCDLCLNNWSSKREKEAGKCKGSKRWLVFDKCSGKFHQGFYVLVKAPQRNFDVVLIVAPRVDKSGTACCCKDLVQHKHLFWRRVKETRRVLFAHKQNIEIIWRKMSSCFQPQTAKKREQLIDRSCEQPVYSLWYRPTKYTNYFPSNKICSLF